MMDETQIQSIVEQSAKPILLAMLQAALKNPTSSDSSIWQTTPLSQVKQFYQLDSKQVEFQVQFNSSAWRAVETAIQMLVHSVEITGVRGNYDVENQKQKLTLIFK